MGSTSDLLSNPQRLPLPNHFRELDELQLARVAQLLHASLSYATRALATRAATVRLGEDSQLRCAARASQYEVFAAPG